MDTPRRWINYDTFKLIVALILLILLIVFIFQAQRPGTIAGIEPTPVTQVSIATSPPQPTQTPVSTPTVLPTATQLPPATPTTAPPASATPESLPSPTTAQMPTATPEATSSPTEAPTATPAVLDTPAPAATAAAVDCPLALPTRLKVGDNARITTNLNLREEPGIGKKLVRTNPTTTQLQIIGGPVCTPYKGSAYLWWNVQLPDGVTGWSAEGSATGKFYFLEPIP